MRKILINLEIFQKCFGYFSKNFMKFFKSSCENLKQIVLKCNFSYGEMVGHSVYCR